MSNEQTNSKQFEQMVLVPLKILEKVQADQERILSVLTDRPKSNSNPNGMVANKYIPESTAKEMLGKGTTWFWQMRKEGKLEFRKVGSKIYYLMESIENLIEGKE